VNHQQSADTRCRIIKVQTTTHLGALLVINLDCYWLGTAKWTGNRPQLHQTQLVWCKTVVQEGCKPQPNPAPYRAYVHIQASSATCPRCGEIPAFWPDTAMNRQLPIPRDRHHLHPRIMSLTGPKLSFSHRHEKHRGLGSLWFG
jgi:hypothetical protein